MHTLQEKGTIRRGTALRMVLSALLDHLGPRALYPTGPVQLSSLYRRCGHLGPRH